MTAGILKHPGRWIWFLFVIPALIGFSRLSLDTEIFNLLPRDLPAVEGLRIHQKHFANARELIVTVRSPDPELSEAAARSVGAELRKATNLVKAVVWEPPWIEHPEQAAELIAHLWLNGSSNSFAALVKKLNSQELPDLLQTATERLATSMSPEEIARLSYDPFELTRLPAEVAGAAPAFGEGQDAFSGDEGRYRVLFVESARELNTYKQCEEWLEKIRVIAERETDGHEELTLGYTGRPVFVAEIARGMQRDMTLSIGLTVAIIAALFWLAHRRIKPMLWLLTLLAFVLAGTLGFGGLIFGGINVVSMGFAAILLGLAVDYAVMHYQEALANPGLSIPRIRLQIAPSILWAAVTTISAFLALNLGGLPGLAQLGTMVAAGVALAALVMVFEFLPPLFPRRNHPSVQVEAVDKHGVNTESSPGVLLFGFPGKRGALFLTVAVIGGAFILFSTGGFPTMTASADPLRPRSSPAYAAMDELRRELAQGREPLWLIIGGGTEDEVATRLETARQTLESAEARGLVSSYSVPAAIWPNLDAQLANRPLAKGLAAQEPELRQALADVGFAPTAFGFAAQVFEVWRSASQSERAFWPGNPMSSWILDKVSARASENFYAIGFVSPAQSRGDGREAARELVHILSGEDQWLTGWELLGDAIFSRVKANFWMVLVPMGCLVMVSLWFAFRRISEVILGVCALVFSTLTLLALMRLFGWSWNLLNLMSIPLVLGTGVDYGIFILLGLKRYGGNFAATYHAVARALLLCGATAIAAFGSLIFAGNAGMASLGAVCALGIACNLFTAIFLLPQWWRIVVPRSSG